MRIGQRMYIRGALGYPIADKEFECVCVRDMSHGWWRSALQPKGKSIKTSDAEILLECKVIDRRQNTVHTEMFLIELERGAKMWVFGSALVSEDELNEKGKQE